MGTTSTVDVGDIVVKTFTSLYYHEDEILVEGETVDNKIFTVGGDDKDNREKAVGEEGNFG